MYLVFCLILDKTGRSAENTAGQDRTNEQAEHSQWGILLRYSGDACFRAIVDNVIKFIGFQTDVIPTPTIPTPVIPTPTIPTQVNESASANQQAIASVRNSSGPEYPRLSW